MELKYKKAFDNYVTDGSNRTFMELKFGKEIAKATTLVKF